MPHINQRKYHSHFHKVKRLHHTSRHGEHLMISHLPPGLIDDNFFDKTSKYTKYFDYPLPQLLVDHSTDPLQNTTRQYTDKSLNISNEGRFVNHEMIIRRNGETTILRPKQDLVLANGFTPVIRPSSILPSYQSILSHSQVLSSSSSIMNKMSVKKSEQTSVIKTKRKHRHRRKRCNEEFIEQNHVSNYNFSNEFEHNNPQESNFLHLVKQALHEMIEQKQHLPPPQQPLPLMSILPQFPNPYNQSFPPRIEERYFSPNPIQSPCFNEPQYISPLSSTPNNSYKESSYDLPREQYHHFEQNHSLYFNRSPQEHVCLHPSISHQRNYTHMPGYFFD